MSKTVVSTFGAGITGITTGAGNFEERMRNVSMPTTKKGLVFASAAMTGRTEQIGKTF